MRAIIIPCILMVAAAAPVQAQPRTCETAPAGGAATARMSQAAADSIRASEEARQLLENHLGEAARAAGIARPRGIVLAEPHGRETPRVWSYRSNVPDELSRTVLARHAETLARAAGRGGAVGLRLDPLPAPDPVTRECMPVLRNPEELMRGVTRIQAWPRNGTPGQSRHVTLHLVMLVTREGDVAYAELRGSSINERADRAVVQMGRRLRFRPATRGNVPVDTWVTQPLNLEVMYE